MGREGSLVRGIIPRTSAVPLSRDRPGAKTEYNVCKGERARKLRRPFVPRTTRGRAAFLEQDSLRSGEAVCAGRHDWRGPLRCQAGDLSQVDRASPSNERIRSLYESGMATALRSSRSTRTSVWVAVTIKRSSRARYAANS